MEAKGKSSRKDKHKGKGVLHSSAERKSLSTSRKVNYEYDAAVVSESLYVVKEVTGLASVPKHATHYKMNHKHGGIAYVFNHEIFDDPRIKRRPGASEDCKTLKECLGGLGFDVQVFQDLKSEEIEAQIRSAAKQDYTQHNCILVVVMSYGGMDNIRAKDFPYKPDYLWTSFTANKCPSLAGKPKMFFLQTSAEDKPETFITTRMSATDGEILESYRIPVQSDFLIVNSTAKGSWFIQALCKEMKEKAREHDLMTILTFVSQRVALGLKSYQPDSAIVHDHIPCVLSMLTRLVKFNTRG